MSIYKGYNPIYEQMATDSSTVASGPVDLVNSIYNYIISILLPSGLKETDTSEGFDTLSKNVQSANDFNSLKNSLMELAGKCNLSDADKSKSTEYINELFDSLMKMPDVNSKFPDVSKRISELISATKDAIGKQQSQNQTNESILLEKGAGSLDSPAKVDNADSDDSSTTDDSDGKNGKIKMNWQWYINTANYLMDKITSLKAQTSTLLEPKLAKRPEVKDIAKKVETLYSDVTMVQITGKRKGLFGMGTGKIPTESGEMNAGELKTKFRNLDGEINRLSSSFNQIKSKATGIAAPPVIVNTAPVDTGATPAPAPPTAASTPGASGASPVTGTSTTCPFPIGVSNKPCDTIKAIQKHLMEQVPCLNDILSKHGGADGKYGKFTSMVCAIAYSVISKKETPVGPLTEDMYKAIMALSGTKKEESSTNEKSVLKFDTFNKIYEQEVKQPTDIEMICQRVKDKLKTMGQGSGGNNKSNPTIPEKKNSDWLGLKPHAGQSLVLSYDESLVSAWTKAGIVTGGVALAVFATPVAGALAAGAEAAGAGVAASAVPLATAGTGLAGALTTGTAANAIGIGGTLTAGGGALSEFFSGRSACGISIATNGFIRKNTIRAMAKGTSDTLSGYVVKEDIQSTMATLCAIRGTWTAKDKKPVSGWALFKKYFNEEFGKDISVAVDSIGTNLVRDVKNFPDFEDEDLSQGDTIGAESAKVSIKEAISQLNSNESNISKNIKDFTEDDIQNSIKTTKKFALISNKKSENKNTKEDSDE